MRRSGGNNATRLLVLPTLHTSSDQDRLDTLANTIREFDDPNLIATVHYYGYWPFSVNVAGGTRFDATAQKDLTDSFDRVYNTFVARGIPVIIGEYGLLGFDRHTGTIEQGEKLKFFEYHRPLRTHQEAHHHAVGQRPALRPHLVPMERPRALRADQVELDDPFRHGLLRPGVHASSRAPSRPRRSR